MKIPEDRNTRAEAMWRIISQRVDFRNKRVIDLGFGTGDFLWRAYVAGADMVIGFDKDVRRIERTRAELGLETSKQKDTLSHAVSVWADTIEELMKTNVMSHDIALCFSVFPYLTDIPATLKWMAKNFPVCLIECQYDGDGPGLSNIGGDRGMMQYLLNEGGFSQAIPLGKTRVEGRKYSDGSPVFRTIWMTSMVASND